LSKTKAKVRKYAEMSLEVNLMWWCGYYDKKKNFASYPFSAGPSMQYALGSCLTGPTLVQKSKLK
jgi:hypothetical protein